MCTPATDLVWIFSFLFFTQLAITVVAGIEAKAEVITRVMITGGIARRGLHGGIIQTGTEVRTLLSSIALRLVIDGTKEGELA